MAVGTLLLLAPEAGTNPAHRAGLIGPDRGDHGDDERRSPADRPAALRNEFLAAYDGKAPLGYPALHHLTSPIRRAAAAQADAEHVNLWAGAGYRSASSATTGRRDPERGWSRDRCPCATSESGDELDDPSEDDAVHDVRRTSRPASERFLIVESRPDGSGQTFVQAARGDDGTYVVGVPGLHERATWRRVEPD